MAKRKIQWHPLFVQLLRPRVEGYYELRTDVPVGDLPRRADLLLLRRTASGPLPFEGLWRFLTTWNILEYKGRTVTARQRDLNLLVELGLGIDRRMNVERTQQGQSLVPEEEVSFWYVVNRLGRRFLADAESRLGPLEACAEGVWRHRVLGYPLMLVSVVDLSVDDDSLPLHVIGVEPAEKEREVGHFLMGSADRLTEYGTRFASLHKDIWREVEAMARKKRQEPEIDIRPAVEWVGLSKAIKQIGEKEIIKEIGEKEFIRQIGEKEVIKQIGEKEVIKQIGKKKIVDEFLDVDDIVASLSPEKRRQLARRLNGGAGKS